MATEKKPDLSKTLKQAEKVGKEAWGVLKDLSILGFDATKKQIAEMQKTKKKSKEKKK